ncbi:flagellar export chaperone FlgN [Serratia ureilytica]
MENLAQLLDKLLETLQALNGVLEEEHDLLCSGQLPGVALQRVTDAKSQLLATVAYLEQQRWGRKKPAGNVRPTPAMRPGRSLATRSTAGQTLRESAQWPAAPISRSTITLEALAILVGAINRCMADGGPVARRQPARQKNRRLTWLISPGERTAGRRFPRLCAASRIFFLPLSEIPLTLCARLRRTDIFPVPHPPYFVILARSLNIFDSVPIKGIFSHGSE